jgi:hypothetical protein
MATPQYRLKRSWRTSTNLRLNCSSSILNDFQAFRARRTDQPVEGLESIPLGPVKVAIIPFKFLGQSMKFLFFTKIHRPKSMYLHAAQSSISALFFGFLITLIEYIILLRPDIVKIKRENMVLDMS